MEVNNIYLLALTLSSIVTAYLAVKEARSKRDNTVADAMQKLAATLGLTTNELSEALVDAAKLRNELHVLQSELETQKRKAEGVARELETHRVERDKEIEEIKAKQRADLVETALLRTEVEALRMQVKEGDRKYQSAKKVIEKLVQAMKDAGLPVPDFNGDLSDSIRGYRMPK